MFQVKKLLFLILFLQIKIIKMALFRQKQNKILTASKFNMVKLHNLYVLNTIQNM
ncbi:hypothetical protein FC89_GL001223 [Liquorilactobacillus ghanensis DSM 18630]|jgi:hypothetical protein|uniref:Uncharacterized protein n=1 Tax=Liquorilactobacillus ghanensis DSM 18630 TaxID=1423750 RepID=A0A0R1VQC8_9LACO|nr:hypothetical protein FC89_GL001223 [Liquorilactobacillus ghanensis DSM 18630]